MLMSLGKASLPACPFFPSLGFAKGNARRRGGGKLNMVNWAFSDMDERAATFEEEDEL